MKVMENASMKIVDKQTGEVLMEQANVNVTIKKKRLKKDCPCSKCNLWRQERAARKLHKAWSEAHPAAIRVTMSVKKSPESESFFKLSSAALGAWPSQEQPQTIPRETQIENQVLIGKSK